MNSLIQQHRSASSRHHSLINVTKCHRISTIENAISPYQYHTLLNQDIRIFKFYNFQVREDIVMFIWLQMNLQIIMQPQKSQSRLKFRNVIIHRPRNKNIIFTQSSRHSQIMYFSLKQKSDEIVLVLEYFPNGQIHKILKGIPEYSFPEKLASSYILQIICALIYSHRNGIILRDLKPENIFLCYNQIKIADFTYSVSSAKDQRQTQCGSLAYLSPEIVRGENYDKSTDMWSLGVLAYELCCGETPWEDLRQDEIQQMIQDGIIKMPDSFSCELKDFISKLVTYDSKSRMAAKKAISHP